MIYAKEKAAGLATRIVGSRMCICIHGMQSCIGGFDSRRSLLFNKRPKDTT